MNEPEPDELVEGRDFYMDGEFLVFTAEYHRKRGYCCGSGCRHCPYGDGEHNPMVSPAEHIFGKAIP